MTWPGKKVGDDPRSAAVKADALPVGGSTGEKKTNKKTLHIWACLSTFAPALVSGLCLYLFSFFWPKHLQFSKALCLCHWIHQSGKRGCQDLLLLNTNTLHTADNLHLASLLLLFVIVYTWLVKNNAWYCYNFLFPYAPCIWLFGFVSQEAFNPLAFTLARSA